MKYNIFKTACLALGTTMVLASCAKKLDLFPQNDFTSEKAYSTPAGYKQVLAKIYGSLSASGNTGPNDGGGADITGLDQGSQIAFIRSFFTNQELPTDEAVCFWNDQTIKSLHNFTWTSDDPFLKGTYARPIWNITLINEYLRESSDEKLTSRGITGAALEDINKSKAEVRFLRAFNYWIIMDLFGKSTFITEADLVGSALPKEISRKELFDYIESELKTAETDLPATPVEYGRVGKAAAQSLLARMYLNAEVYIGAPKYTEAITFASKVIPGYSLNQTVRNGYSAYSQLFMADNDRLTNEIIWAVNCDGLNTQSYGSTTFIVNASCGSDKPTDFFAGSTGAGWQGLVSTKAFAALFPDLSGATDKRAMFTTAVYSPTPANIELPLNLLSINETFFQNAVSGLHINKYRNMRSDNLPIKDVTNYTFADIDFPIFRLPEMYLIYAEAVLRGGTGGSEATAVSYINLIRNRSGAGNIAAITRQDVLDERGRELYWEGHRRTDLIRYGLLTTGTYLWPWKGGVSTGTAVDAKYNLFPIPASARIANTNLTQNPGY